MKKEYAIINLFKTLDLNNDGRASKEEILNVFGQVGLNVLNEIDFIMEHLDTKKSGFIDYTELILALTNWAQELKIKNLSKVFCVDNGLVSVDSLKTQLSEVFEENWQEFIRAGNVEKGKISIENLKKYLKSHITN